MTRTVAPFRDVDLLDLIEGRDRRECPICFGHHCITIRGRFWTHGPIGRRCRGSQRTAEGAAYAARTVRGRPVVDVPTGAVL